jgi:apolipoprotein N-acyltransferase
VAYDRPFNQAVTPGGRSPDVGLPDPLLEEAVPSAFTREDILASRFRLARVLPYQQSAPFISNVLLAIFSGALMVFAFPDWALWSLGWVATAPLIMAVVREQRFLRSFALGLLSGTIFFVGSSSWVTYSMHNYGGLSLWLSYALTTLAAAILACFTGLFAGVLALTLKRFGGWGILAAPAIWAASEWSRLILTGMGWNALGYSQAFQPAVIQIAGFGGVYIVSAMLVAASSALVFGLVYLERRRGFIAFTTVGILVLGAVFYGKTQQPEPEPPGPVTLAVVQPNIPVAGAWSDPSFVDEMLQRHVNLSEQAIRSIDRGGNGWHSGVTDEPGHKNDVAGQKQPRVNVVVWPESPMNFEYDRDPALRQKLAEFTRRNEVYLLMNTWGYDSEEPTSDRVYNSALLIGPDGRRISRYDKLALMPFGEYVPARGLIPFMDRIPALVGDVTPGTTIALSDADGARLGVSICFETTRPDLARKIRRAGASVLLQMSNENWFGTSAISSQMMAEAIFRAVENNIELIRATNSGVSTRIDRYGLPHDETPRSETAIRVWGVDKFGEPLTFYTRHGDVFAVSCAGLSVILLGSALLKKIPRRWLRTQTL